MSGESINTPSTSDNSLAPVLSYVGNKIRVKFDGICIKQDKITFNHEKIVNICIAYEINRAYDDIRKFFVWCKKWYKKMFGFILKMLHVETGSIGLNINALKCDSMSNHGCKVRPEMINIVIMSLYFICTVFL